MRANFAMAHDCQKWNMTQEPRVEHIFTHTHACVPIMCDITGWVDVIQWRDCCRWMPMYGWWMFLTADFIHYLCIWTGTAKKASVEGTKWRRKRTAPRTQSTQSGHVTQTLNKTHSPKWWLIFHSAIRNAGQIVHATEWTMLFFHPHVFACDGQNMRMKTRANVKKGFDDDDDELDIYMHERVLVLFAFFFWVIYVFIRMCIDSFGHTDPKQGPDFFHSNANGTRKVCSLFCHQKRLHLQHHHRQTDYCCCCRWNIIFHSTVHHITHKNLSLAKDSISFRYMIAH